MRETYNKHSQCRKKSKKTLILSYSKEQTQTFYIISRYGFFANLQSNISLATLNRVYTKYPYRLSASYVNQKFKNEFAKFRSRDIKIINLKTWNYFPRFAVQEMADGILWKTAEHQGEMSTWFVGSSVIFESTKSVLEYNKLTINRMML